MIREITYLIKFPLGASFQKPFKYLLLKSIFNDIKDKTCSNKERLCKECQESKNCLYHLLSGEDFKEFAGVIVDKAYLEKQSFSIQDSIKVSFYLIGITSIYEDFIHEYFRTHDFLKKQYFQKILIESNNLDESKNYDGYVRFITPFNEKTNINNQLSYFNCNYKTEFETVCMIEKQEGKFVKDETNYYFSKQKFRLNGYIGKYAVKNYSRALMKIGIGKENIIGGGRSICESE